MGQREMTRHKMLKMMTSPRHRNEMQPSPVATAARTTSTKPSHLNVPSLVFINPTLLAEKPKRRYVSALRTTILIAVSSGALPPSSTSLAS